MVRRNFGFQMLQDVHPTRACPVHTVCVFDASMQHVPLIGCSVSTLGSGAKVQPKVSCNLHRFAHRCVANGPIVAREDSYPTMYCFVFERETKTHRIDDNSGAHRETCYQLSVGAQLAPKLRPLTSGPPQLLRTFVTSQAVKW